VAKYLSEAWLAETITLSADQPIRPGASARINQVVSGGPDGEVQLAMVLADGRIVESRLGALVDADMTLTSSWADSVAMAQGELDVNAAFMQGKLKVSGNMAKLLALLPLASKPECQQLQARLLAVTEF